MADPPTLDDLIQGESEDTALTFLLTSLASIGFPTTSWSPTGRIYSALRVFAKGLSNVFTAITEITKGGLLGLSTKGWLTLLSKEQYDNTRFEATFAEGTVTLTVAAGAGPYPIAPGASIVYETLTLRRYFSTNVTTVTLPAGPSTTPLTYRAEFKGSAYNAPLGASMGFVTPLPGVTATLTDTQGTGTWLTKQGTDEEADEPLRTRDRTRWATLGLQKPEDAYVYLAMNVPGVGTPATKVKVDASNPHGPGTMDIWLASNAGPLPAADEALVAAYLESLASPAAQDGLQVANALVLAISVAVRIEYQGVFATAIAEARDAVKAYVDGLPIGGKILFSQVIEEIMAIAGVVNVPVGLLTINGTNGDVQLLANQVAVFTTWTATPVIVA
jgi:uncharacterized phage protein gp47/JayE